MVCEISKLSIIMIVCLVRDANTTTDVTPLVLVGIGFLKVDEYIEHSKIACFAMAVSNAFNVGGMLALPIVQYA